MGTARARIGAPRVERGEKKRRRLAAGVDAASVGECVGEGRTGWGGARAEERERDSANRGSAEKSGTPLSSFAAVRAPHKAPTHASRLSLSPFPHPMRIEEWDTFSARARRLATRAPLRVRAVLKYDARRGRLAVKVTDDVAVREREERKGEGGEARSPPPTPRSPRPPPLTPL